MKFDEIKIIEDKYLPEGFMLIEDSEGTSFFEIATGKKTLIPKFTLDVELPREYTVEGDKIFGNLIGTLRFPR